MSNTRNFRRTAMCLALGLGLAALGAPALAGNNDGSVVGHAQPGAVITASNPATGLSRTVTADSRGSYRFAFLPIGDYTLSASKDGQSVGQPRNVTVSLGNASTVDLAAAPGATELAAINVVGTGLPVIDVTSTESATNVSREELVRLPVDQNVAAVSLLAPGVVKGNAAFGGLSFGGSSIAENAFYVNGLNVTDFYNRNGFSEAPFAFYQEFQVKTGGYSVEFGRTTGGVVNAVARSGSNVPKAGMEVTLEPGNWHSVADDHYDAAGRRYLTASRDRGSLVKTNVWASGPIIKDKLFIFAMYEARGSTPRNTNNAGTTLTANGSDSGFWGTTIDWNITDSNVLQLMAFSDKNKNTGDVYSYDFDTNTLGTRNNQVFTDTGGKNWALTWTSYLTNDLSMKLMTGRNERQAFTRSQLDLDCNYVSANNAFLKIHNPGIQIGCTSNSTIYNRNDTRKQARADFEWTLGDHLLRFGYDHEDDTSDYNRHYAGPGAFYYNLYAAKAGDTIANGGVVPPGYDAYVRARRYEIAGTFTTKNAAYYIEDSWQVSPNLVLNAGVRNDSFDNQDAEGRSYIKMNSQIAPRLGFSWDMKGDGSTKVFGNLGRYFLPVANVINIKQAGGLLDERTYYAFNGWDYRRAAAGTADRRGRQFAGRRHGWRPAFGGRPRHGPGVPGRGHPRLPADARRKMVVGRFRYLPAPAQRDRRHGNQRDFPMWRKRLHRLGDGQPGQESQRVGRHQLRRRCRWLPYRRHQQGRLGDVRRRWQLPGTARLGQAQAHVCRGRAATGSRVGRAVVDECVVHHVLEPRQRGRPGQFRH